MRFVQSLEILENNTLDLLINRAGGKPYRSISLPTE